MKNTLPIFLLATFLQLFALYTAQTYTEATITNDIYPTIGIISCSNTTTNNYSIVKKTYPDWVHASGGRAVVIQWDLDDSALQLRLNSCNGFVFVSCPGDLFTVNASAGGTRTYGDILNRTKYIFDYLSQQNNAGYYLPIIAFGEAVSRILVGISSDNFLPERITGMQGVRTGIILNDNGRVHNMFSEFPADFLTEVEANAQYAYHNFQYAIKPEDITASALLTDYTRVLATSTAANSESFVDILEVKGKPFYLFQELLPEMWDRYVHTSESADIGLQDGANGALLIGRWFMQEARKNQNIFPSTALQESIAFKNKQAYRRINEVEQYYYEFNGTGIFQNVPDVTTVTNSEYSVAVVVIEVLLGAGVIIFLYRKDIKKLFRKIFKRGSDDDEIDNDLDEYIK